MKKPEYIHRGYIKNGKLEYDRPEMMNMKLTLLEGKRFEMSLEQEFQSMGRSQRGYYFGGIIRSEMMESNCFAGFTEKELHQMLMEKLRSYHKTIHDTTIEFVEDFSSYSKEEMKKYIDDVVSYLALEFDIHCKNPDEYKLNQYVYEKCQ